MRLFNPARRFEYVLREDAGSERPTTFILRRLTWAELGEFAARSPYTLEQSVAISRIVEAARAEGHPLGDEDNAAIEAIAPTTTELLAKLTHAFADVVREGVVEIRGLLDEHGNPLAMSPADFARAAPPAVIQELGNEILARSRLAEDDRKNSPAPPGPGA